MGLCHAVHADYAMLCYAASGAFLALAAAVLVRVEPSCSGSGLPEVKATLSGVVLYNSLMLRTLLLKPLALVLAVTSGLSIGKEGALVHSACCLAHQIAESKYIGFNQLRIEQRRVELMVAACAVGVVGTFGAPVGGVLFSIEITSSFYLVDHLVFAFFCATLSLVWTSQLLLLIPGPPMSLSLFKTDFSSHSCNALELILFALFGALIAALTSLLPHAVRQAAALRKRLEVRFGGWTPLVLPPVVAAVCSASYFALDGGSCGGLYANGGGLLLPHLFDSHGHSGAAETTAEALQLLSPTLLQYAIFGIGKLFLLTPASVVLATPTGVFLPTFVSGAALGRVFGLLVYALFPNSSLIDTALPGRFAVCGAAALTTAATGTLSTAVVTLELSGQLSLQPALLVTGISAYLVSRLLKVPSLFDLFSTLKQLPGATTGGFSLAGNGPFGTNDQSIRTCFGERLHPLVLPHCPTYADLWLFLGSEGTKMLTTGISCVPVVRSLEDPVLLGCISRRGLEMLLTAQPHASETSAPSETTEPGSRARLDAPAARGMPLQEPDSPLRAPLLPKAREVAEASADSDLLRCESRGSVPSSSLSREPSHTPSGEDAHGGDGRRPSPPFLSRCSRGGSSVSSVRRSKQPVNLLYDGDGELRADVDLAPLTVWAA